MVRKIVKNTKEVNLKIGFFYYNKINGCEKMEKEFEKIYEELKNEFGEKYKPLLSNNVTQSALYMFFAWLIISFVTMFFKRMGLENLSLYIKCCGLKIITHP